MNELEGLLLYDFGKGFAFEGARICSWVMGKTGNQAGVDGNSMWTVIDTKVAFLEGSGRRPVVLTTVWIMRLKGKFERK